MNPTKLNTAKIKFEIDRLGWTQAELADRAGMSRQALNMVLKNESTTLKRINKLARALMITPKDLLT